MKTTLLIILFLLIVSASFSQKITINARIEERNLAWGDFSGQPDQNSPYSATTYWYVTYSYTGVLFKGDTAFLKDLTAELKLESKKSWVKKEHEEQELLQHEQGHFDIGHLLMLDFLLVINQTTLYRLNFEEKVNMAFKEILNKYKEMELKYDAETNHYKDKVQQARWTTFLKDELKKFGA